jgi:hypothetical protein
VQFAVLGDDVLTAIRDQKIVGPRVRVVPGGVHLKAETIDITNTLGPQFLLHVLEEIVIGIPGLRDVRHLVAGLLDQRSPDMVHRSADGIGHTVNTALLLDIVIAADREQRGLGVFLPLRLDDLAHVHQLVLPGVERNDLGGGVLEQVGDDAADHRRDDLLAHRRIGDNAVVKRVAAGLLVIGNDHLERNILFLRETLNPPHGRGRGRRVGDIGPRQRANRAQSEGTAKHRTPRQSGHLRLLPHAPIDGDLS